MRLVPRVVERRAKHRGLHGHEHISRERRNALLMIRTAQIRVVWWAIMLLIYPVSTQARHLYGLTSFVTILSILALLLTDWGQYAASKAQLAAADAHHDAEATRSAVTVDFAAIERDIARLAELQPGPEAAQLADEIRARLSQNSATGG